MWLKSGIFFLVAMGIFTMVTTKNETYLLTLDSLEDGFNKDSVTMTTTCFDTSCSKTSTAESPDLDSTNATDVTSCDNSKGWNLKGYEWGCCGNYEGCCTYASFLCYIHDAMCRCCDVAEPFCGPKCKPEPGCSNLLSLDQGTNVSTTSNMEAKGVSSTIFSHENFTNVANLTVTESIETSDNATNVTTYSTVSATSLETNFIDEDGSGDIDKQPDI